MKPIRMSQHALLRRAERGFTPDQVETAIREAEWNPTQRGRLQCEMDFDYARTWTGRYFDTIRVRPIFVEEADEIVVITVYTYLF